MWFMLVTSFLYKLVLKYYSCGDIMGFICSVSMNIVCSTNNLADLYLLYFPVYKMTTNKTVLP
jgi:hypothetical protein